MGHQKTRTTAGAVKIQISQASSTWYALIKRLYDQKEAVYAVADTFMLNYLKYARAYAL